MGRLYLIADSGEIVERRKQLPGRLIEAWPDLYQPGDYWMDEESKVALDSVGDPIQPKLVLPGGAVPIYYGPRLGDLESLPREDSLQTRVLSAHGIAVVCVTVGSSGERAAHTPQSPLDPVFFLRRPGGSSAHVWRLFTTKREAMSWVAQSFPADPEAVDWATTLPVESYTDLLDRRAAPE